MKSLEELGLSMGQMRPHEIVHNGSWYLKDGTKVGWGDLNSKDLERLPKLVDEPLFVLPEGSFWNRLKWEGETGKAGDLKITVEDLLKECYFVILPGMMFHVHDPSWAHSEEKMYESALCGDPAFKFISVERSEVHELL